MAVSVTVATLLVVHGHGVVCVGEVGPVAVAVAAAAGGGAVLM